MLDVVGYFIIISVHILSLGPKTQEAPVPKMKTKKAVAKRFKLTKNGKVIRRNQLTGHFMCGKSSKRRRNLRRASVMTGGSAKNIAKLLQG